MASILGLLKRLAEEQVRFVLVGGMAAAAHGASLVTADVDVCVPFDEENLRRILRALSGLNPRMRMSPTRPALPTDPGALAGLRNLSVVCDAGQLDLFGQLTGVGDYERLAARAISLDLGDFTCPVISVEDLIVAKRAVGRPKDLRAAEELEAIRQMKRP